MNDFQVVQEIPIVWELKIAHLEEDVFVLAIDVKTRRKASYYLMNVALVMFVIISLVLCSWAVHPGDIQARHNVDYMLLLTAVAYKLVLCSTLPPVSYVTIMDVYIMFGFFFLTLVIIVHTMLPFSHTQLVDNSPLTMPSQFNSEEESLIEADKICFRVFAGTWGAWNIIYFVYMYVHGQERQEDQGTGGRYARCKREQL
uniref:Neurotransmitter-gated ion-channel transmembrane domain-containing protein n=1 Tax=Alexandrium catenella TaxID=2925 RepID=A0A7S1PLF3_ALECA